MVGKLRYKYWLFDDLTLLDLGYDVFVLDSWEAYHTPYQAWIGCTLAVTSSSKPIEEIEREFEKELKNIEDKSVKEKAGEAGF